jgi:hypothetical protein
MPRSVRADSKAKAATPDDDDDDGKTVEEIRRELALKLAMIVSDWRKCRRRVCQRRRGCVPAASGCLSPREPRRVMTPAQAAAERAKLYRTLQRHLAAMGCEDV